MAEENKNGQSKGIGELFVEFGTKGLPSLIKGLNSVSATFLLTKNAAEQFTKPIREMYKESQNTALGIGKMSAMIGASSMVDIQKLQNYFNEKNVDAGSMMSGINNMMNLIYDLQHGLGGIDGKMNFVLSELGIDIWEYNDGLESTLDLYDDLYKATKNLSAVDRNAYLRLLGQPQELAYLFERGGINKSDILGQSTQQVLQQIEAIEAKNRRTQAIKDIKDDVISRIAPVETAVNNKIGDTAIEHKEDISSGIVNVSKETGKAAGNAMLATPIGRLGVLSGLAAIGFKNLKNKAKEPEGVPTGFAINPFEGITPLNPPNVNVPAPGMESAALPPNMNEMTSSVINNNTFNITGSNANEIADNVVAKLDIEALRNNQFQIENMPTR